MTSAKRVIPVITSMLLLVLTILVVPQAIHVIPKAHGANRTVSLIGNYYGWNYSQPSGTNPPITVTQGDVVMISLSSGDGATHQFALDVDQDGSMVSGTTCPSNDRCSGNFGPSAGSISITVNFGPGTYKYFCTYHSAMVGNFIVQSAFSISANPSSLSFIQGSSTTSTITLTSQNGFSGTVSLSAASSPSGLTTSFKPPSVTLSSGMQTSIMSVNSTGGTPSGSYTVTVTGTSGTVMNPTTVFVTVNPPASEDFSLALGSSSLSVAQDSTGTTTITLTSQNGFSGNVNLTGTVSPSGPTVSLSPKIVAVSAGYPGSSTLTVSAMGGSSVATGTYVVNITATSGSLSRSKTEQVTVTSTTTPSAPLNIPTTVLAGVVIAVIAAIVAAVLLARRRPRQGP